MANCGQNIFLTLFLLSVLNHREFCNYHCVKILVLRGGSAVIVIIRSAGQKPIMEGAVTVVDPSPNGVADFLEDPVPHNHILLKIAMQPEKHVLIFHGGLLAFAARAAKRSTRTDKDCVLFADVRKKTDSPKAKSLSEAGDDPPLECTKSCHFRYEVMRSFSNTWANPYL